MRSATVDEFAKSGPAQQDLATWRQNEEVESVAAPVFAFSLKVPERSRRTGAEVAGPDRF
jgi:hypothetical protein